MFFSLEKYYVFPFLKNFKKENNFLRFFVSQSKMSVLDDFLIMFIFWNKWLNFFQSNKKEILNSGLYS